MPNNITNLTDKDLLALGAALAVKVTPTNNGYGVSTGQATALTAGSAALTTSLSALDAARLAEKAAMQAKGAKRTAMIDAVQAIVSTIYANPAVTDEMLVAVGLAPRRTGRPASRVPYPPTGLVVQAFDDGTVKLKWNRNGNPTSTTYLVETSADGLSWTLMDSVVRMSYVGQGFTPGVGAWFRVIAKSAAGRSVPCSKVCVYTPDPTPVQLRVA